MNARGATALIALVVAAATGWWLWNGAERQIRRMLDDVAAAVSGPADRSPLGYAAVASGLHRHLDEHVVIEPGRAFEPIAGRDAVLAAAVRLRGIAGPVQVAFEDVQIDLSPDGRGATVRATVTARDGSQVDAREVELLLARIDGRWVIRRAAVVPSLRRLD